MPTDTESTQTIVAVTGEDDRYGAIRSRASALAAGGQGTVILYDLDAGGLFASPVPTAWSGEGERELIDEEAGPRDRLDPDELDTAGRGAVADQVRAAALDGRRRLGVAADVQGRRGPRRVRRAPGRDASCWSRRTSSRATASAVPFEVVGYAARPAGNRAERPSVLSEAATPPRPTRTPG